MNIEDLLKIGTLYLQKGQHNGKQILSSQWIEQSQTSYKKTHNSKIGSFGYGYQWWTLAEENGQNPISFYLASGLFGQYIIIVPTLNIVASVRSNLKHEDQSLPLHYFCDLLRSIKENQDKDKITSN
jgi:CubicO group peptidase (beta-lactamase class C family)